MMRFYKQQHQFYCGVDLHTKQTYRCIVDSEGNTLKHINLKTEPDAFLSLVEPYREDLVDAAQVTVCVVLIGRTTHNSGACHC